MVICTVSPARIPQHCLECLAGRTARSESEVGLATNRGSKVGGGAERRNKLNLTLGTIMLAGDRLQALHRCAAPDEEKLFCLAGCASQSSN